MFISIFSTFRATTLTVILASLQLPLFAIAQQSSDVDNHARCDDAWNAKVWRSIINYCSSAASEDGNAAQNESGRAKYIDTNRAAGEILQVGLALSNIGANDKAAESAHLAANLYRSVIAECPYDDIVAYAKKGVDLAVSLLSTFQQSH